MPVHKKHTRVNLLDNGRKLEHGVIESRAVVLVRKSAMHYAMMSAMNVIGNEINRRPDPVFVRDNMLVHVSRNLFDQVGGQPLAKHERVPLSIIRCTAP